MYNVYELQHRNRIKIVLQISNNRAPIIDRGRKSKFIIDCIVLEFLWSVDC